MPRRRKPAEGPDSRGQDGEEEEEEKRGPANAKKKRSFVDAFIIISDSDGEVSGQPAGPWESAHVLLSHGSVVPSLPFHVRGRKSCLTRK